MATHTRKQLLHNVTWVIIFSTKPKKRGPNWTSTCERVDTFFSPRIWHHAGRPTTGHSAETIGTNSKHTGRRTIARYPWNNRRSKPEFLQKMNLTNHFNLIIYTRLTDIWNGSSRSIFMILISFESSQWDEYDSSDNFQFENFEKIFNLIILIDNSEKRVAAIFELSLWQQSVFKVFQLLEKHLDQSEIPLQEVKKIRYWPRILSSDRTGDRRGKKWMKDTIRYYTSPSTTFLDIFAL